MAKDKKVGHVWKRDELIQALRNDLEIEAACGVVKVPTTVKYDILCEDCERIDSWSNRDIQVNPTDIRGAVFMNDYHVGDAVLYDHGQVRVRVLGRVWWFPRWWKDDADEPKHAFAIQIELSDIPENAELEDDNDRYFAKLVK